jgi:hypothetical protein
MDDANEDAQVEMIAAANDLARSMTFESEALRTGDRLNTLYCEGAKRRGEKKPPQRDRGRDT